MTEKTRIATQLNDEERRKQTLLKELNAEASKAEGGIAILQEFHAKVQNEYYKGDKPVEGLKDADRDYYNKLMGDL